QGTNMPTAPPRLDIPAWIYDSGAWNSWRRAHYHIVLALPLADDHPHAMWGKPLCRKTLRFPFLVAHVYDNVFPADPNPICQSCLQVATNRGTALPPRDAFPLQLYLKDEDAFLRGESVCYRPAGSSDRYTRDDFLAVCNDDEDEAFALFRRCTGNQLGEALV